MSDRWDLVVAGAGPAGCALAAKVAASGARVLLLERESEPGAGRDWVVDVERGTFAAARVPEPTADEVFVEPEKTLLVTSDRKYAIELLPAPVVPVRNAAYVRKLAEWAVDSGAVLRTSCPVSGPVIEAGAVAGVVTAAKGEAEEEVQATIVADCTGISGALRRKTPRAWRLADEVSPSDVVLARRETRSIDGGAAATLGDSACQVIPAHGSGTASALIAAELASLSILRALEQGRGDRQALWGYNHAFQSGRGALLAYYDVIRRHTSNLTVEDLTALITGGFLGAREVYSGLIPEVPRVGAAGFASKARGALESLPLLARFAKAGMAAARTMEHFRDYPPFYRPGAVEDWARGMPS